MPTDYTYVVPCLLSWTHWIRTLARNYPLLYRMTLPIVIQSSAVYECCLSDLNQPMKKCCLIHFGWLAFHLKDYFDDHVYHCSVPIPLNLKSNSNFSDTELIARQMNEILYWNGQMDRIKSYFFGSLFAKIYLLVMICSLCEWFAVIWLRDEVELCGLDEKGLFLSIVFVLWLVAL